MLPAACRYWRLWQRVKFDKVCLVDGQLAGELVRSGVHRVRECQRPSQSKRGLAFLLVYLWFFSIKLDATGLLPASMTAVLPRKLRRRMSPRPTTRCLSV